MSGTRLGRQYSGYLTEVSWRYCRCSKRLGQICPSGKPQCLPHQTWIQNPYLRAIFSAWGLSQLTSLGTLGSKTKCSAFMNQQLKRQVLHPSPYRSTCPQSIFRLWCNNISALLNSFLVIIHFRLVVPVTLAWTLWTSSLNRTSIDPGTASTVAVYLRNLKHHLLLGSGKTYCPELPSSFLSCHWLATSQFLFQYIYKFPWSGNGHS